MMSALAEADQPQIELVSDASGSWGCGAWWNSRWFQLCWESAPATREWSIMPKEMLPIVVALVIWGNEWKGSTVRIHCDNMAVVATIKACSCKEVHTMHLIRCLAFLEAIFECVLIAEHIKGKDNMVANALSRNKLSLAQSIMQGAAAEAARVHPELVKLLTETVYHWRESEWNKLRRLISRTA